MTQQSSANSSRDRFLTALQQLWNRSAYDRGFISNPFAGDDFAMLGLRRTQELLARLGNPHDTYPIFHIAGSKGKGSTSAFAASILRSSGLRTGRYTSPHLHTFRERFAIDDVLITEGTFADLWDRSLSEAVQLEHVEPELGHLTAFELTTAMAFDYFATNRCDAAVVEVGLGGTLDSTNVITPVSTVITALDFEHTRVLGSTLAEIAENKAGIVKPGVPVATAEMATEALAVVARRVEEMRAEWLLAGRDWRWERTGRNFDLHGPWGTYRNLRSGLIGDHQIDNASLAIAGLWLMLGDTLTESAIRTGLASTSWPGRFEVLKRDSQTIVLDGAHTPAAAAALVRAFKEEFPAKHATIVLGVLNDKDPVVIMNSLREIASKVIAVTPRSPRALPAMQLAEALRGFNIPLDVAESMDEALDQSTQHLVVTGSLTTVASAREVLGLGDADPTFIT